MSEDLDALKARIALLERENAKLQKINHVLMRRAEEGLADNGNSFMTFQVSVELEQRIQERTRALEKAMSDLEASHFALNEAKLSAELAQGRLDAAVDTIADAFALWSPDDTLLRFNQRFADLFPGLRSVVKPGLRFEAFLQAVLATSLVLDANQDPEGWLNRRLRYHQNPRESMMLALTDGRWQRVSERITVDGGRVAIYTDITDIKRQEQRLRERDLAAHSELLQATMNSIRQGIAVFDQQGRLMAWNPRFCELMLLPAHTLQVGMHLALPEGGLCCPLESALECVCVSGRALEIQYNPMPNGSFVMSYVDVSDRKQAELALRESEAKMRLITDALPALIAYVDHNQVYRFINKGYEDWFGLPKSAINGRPMRDVLGATLFDARSQYVERALSGEPSTFELQLPAPRRSIEYALATFVPHFAENGDVLGFFALIQDITESRRAERALAQAKQDLELRVIERTAELQQTNVRLREAVHATEEAQRGKTRFFAAASHDLLQPLNAARLFLAALDNQVVSPQARRMANNACASLEAVDDLINTLLEISRLDAGAVEANPIHFSIAALLDQLATEFAPLADSKQLSLRLHAMDAVVYSDWVLLGRVLRNFLSNAIRYTSHGGLLLGCRRQPEGVLIGVWDQGTGISEEKLPEIFGEFLRLPEHSAMCQKGMGLGLAIVQRLAARLEHRLVVRSRLGRGSLFGIVVPYGSAEAVALPVAEPTKEAEAHGVSRSGACILLIDNDASILEGMQTLLSDWHYRTLAASSAADAIAHLKETGIRPDAILADYHLDHDEMGTEAIRAVNRYLNDHIPAALVTADHSDELRQEAEQSGWAWLGKPVRPARLRALLGHLLRPH